MEDVKKNKKNHFETLAVLALFILLSILLPQAKGLFSLLPIVYLLVDKIVRKRSFADIGFRWKNIWKDIKGNWHLMLLVAVVTQVGTILLARAFVPEFYAHVVSRVPVMAIDQLVPLFLMILVGTFAEEIVYRGFLQERLGWFVAPVLSVVIASIVFSAMHYSPGSPGVIAFDIATIFIDSLIYGAIYYRTKNIFASWIPHLLADIVGLVILLTMI